MSQETAPSGSGEGSPWSVVAQVVAKINVQVFLFAIAIVVVVGLVGERIPSPFQVLTYLVVLLALGIYVFQVAMPVIVEHRKHRNPKKPGPAASSAEEEVPAELPQPDQRQVEASDHSAAASDHSAAAAGGSIASSSDSRGRARQSPPKSKG
jgi:cytoskeletal protein RodZ